LKAREFKHYLNNQSLLKKLLLSDWDRNMILETTDKVWDTPLHYALYFSETESFELLLKHGANPDILASDKTSLLYLAVYNYSLKEIILLIKYGVDIQKFIYQNNSECFFEAVGRRFAGENFEYILSELNNYQGHIPYVERKLKSRRLEILFK
jgi:ankyrin repeat protein